ncbi:hypothetical protein CAPTEDRAFT_146194, partial [Capitella teleta]
VTCNFPGHPSKGRVTILGFKYYYGVTATYSCLTGYTLHGSITRVCQSNGQWSNTRPTCQIKNCGNPGIPTYGSAQGSNFEYGRSVVFSCQVGYRLIGQQTLTCGANLRWNYARPTCQIVLCPAPQAPPNGAVSASRTSYRSVASFSCKSGYVMDGHSQRTCQANAHWSGSQPICNPVNCGNPGTPVNGVKQGNTYTLNSKIHYMCRPGYKIAGPTQLTCTHSGKWNGDRPLCLGTFFVYIHVLHE